MNDRKPLPLAMRTVAITLGVFWIALCLLTRNWPWTVFTHRFTVQELGAIGDSFAPITAAFAIAAAVFSVLGYFQQKATLKRQEDWEDEQRDNAREATGRQEKWEREQREKDARTRFDILFFRALEEYDRAFSQMEEATAKQNPGSTGQQLLRELREMLNNGAIRSDNTHKAFWEQHLAEKRFLPVQRFVNSAFAVVLWLDEAAQPGLLLERWMRLFQDRVSGPEHDMLREFIEHLASAEVRAAAHRLHLFQTDNPFICPPPSEGPGGH